MHVAHVDCDLDKFKSRRMLNNDASSKNIDLEDVRERGKRLVRDMIFPCIVNW